MIRLCVLARPNEDSFVAGKESAYVTREGHYALHLPALGEYLLGLIGSVTPSPILMSALVANDALLPY